MPSPHVKEKSQGKPTVRSRSPTSARFRLGDMDTSVKPTEDFYRFANGGWQKRNPVPREYSRWGTFTLLHKENQRRLKQLVEASLGATNDNKTSSRNMARMVADFYASGMDVEKIDKQGLDPLSPELELIDSMKTLGDLTVVLGSLHRMGINAFFGFGSEISRKNSAQTVAGVWQGGLGLPDRDYYLRQGRSYRAVRSAYKEYMFSSFRYAGFDRAKANRAVSSVMRIEARLARAALSRVERRDPYRTWNYEPVQKLRHLVRQLDWDTYFSSLGAPDFRRVNISETRFLEEISRLLANERLESIRWYLHWHLLMEASPYLSKRFENARFRYMSVLTGQKRQQPRWMRVLAAEDNAIGFALGKLYVKEYFPRSHKAEVERIFEDVKNALGDSIRGLTWMETKTKRAALRKLQRMQPMIGYPERWRSYRGLRIDQSSYVRNVLRASAFNTAWDLSLIGKPTDRSIWHMTPQTVNAYYDPSTNQLVFPAAILQPPFYTPKASLALNYGAVGAVIGHEITHGFDDQGRHFDASGRLKDWWTDADSRRFNRRAKRITQQFSSYTVAGRHHVNGELVTGEAIADLGGVVLAYRAFEKRIGEGQKPRESLEGFTASQMFFLGFAHLWASNSRPESLRLQVVRDPHPPANYRVNGTLVNVPEFWKSYSVKANARMRNRYPCKIW